MLALKGSRTEKTLSPAVVSSERAITELLDAATRRGERWMSIFRVVFSVATFVRFVACGGVWRDGRVPVKALFVLTAGIIAIALSLWLVHRTLRGPVSTWILATSTTLDVLLCFAALVSNPLWPGRDYAGIFSFPDGAAIFLVILASSLRLSPMVVWLTAGLSIISTALLVIVDHIKLGSSIGYDSRTMAMVAIIGATCTAFAVLVAWQTRTLVVVGAHASVRAYRAHHAVTTMLQEHHDVHSLLSSANLNAELLLRGLDDEHSQRKTAESLYRDLRIISADVSALKERAFHELTATQIHQGASLAAALRVVTSLVSHRFPDVQIKGSVPDGLHVCMAGGAMVLERVLLNLLINACEGDGAHGATSIWVDVHDDPEWVYLAIADDGPGFPEAALRAPTTYVTSSKRDGGGLGLFLVQNVVAASGGRWNLRQRPGGGACVEVIFPKNEATTPVG